MINPKTENDSLGACRSWKEQQKTISTYIDIRFLNTNIKPRLLLAQFDQETITVYQAYKPSIASAAVHNVNFLGSDFSFSRMTWIKTSFTWMMHRSSWATKTNQEAILAIRLKRSYFNGLLKQAICTTWDESEQRSVKEWHQALRTSDVIVQWDPDRHIISGAKLGYRVIQLGVRGVALQGFDGSGIVSITDITDQVRRLRREILEKPLSDPTSCHNETPREIRYPLPDRPPQQGI